MEPYNKKKPTHTFFFGKPIFHQPSFAMKSLFPFLLSALLPFILFCVQAQPAVQNDPYVCPPCGDRSCCTQLYDNAGQCAHCGMALIKRSAVKNVAIFLFDGVELLDFSGPGEVFAAAHVEDGAFNVYTVAASKEMIRSQGFVTIQPQYTIHDCPKPDIIVLPGGSVMPSVNNPEVIAWINKHTPDATAIMSVCNGAHILQKTGLLDGKKATSHYGAIPSLRKNSPTTEVLENTRWVDNGKILTTAGVSAGIDGALRIVHRMYGLEAAKATARYMEYDKWVPDDGVIVGR
jgi:putative intracellular protease/amidase